MSSFCTAKATHIFFSKKFQHTCVSLDVNFDKSLTNDIISFEQPGPELLDTTEYLNGEQRHRRYFAHVQDDLNLHIFHFCT